MSDHGEPLRLPWTLGVTPAGMEEENFDRFAMVFESFFDLLHGGSAMSTTKICELYQLNCGTFLTLRGRVFQVDVSGSPAERTHDALGEKAKNLVRCTSHLGSVVNDITQVSCGGAVFLKFQAATDGERALATAKLFTDHALVHGSLGRR